MIPRQERPKARFRIPVEYSVAGSVWESILPSIIGRSLCFGGHGFHGPARGGTRLRQNEQVHDSEQARGSPLGCVCAGMVGGGLCFCDRDRTGGSSYRKS